jgi:hypothetical protein
MTLTGIRAHWRAVESAAEDLLRHWVPNATLPGTLAQGLANVAEYTLHIDVSPSLHPCILGSNSNHLADIMSATGTT